MIQISTECRRKIRNLALSHQKFEIKPSFATVLLKQIIRNDNILCIIVKLILREANCCDYDNMNGLNGLSFHTKPRYFVLQDVMVVSVYGVATPGILHLADVNDLIVAVNKHINLCAFLLSCLFAGMPRVNTTEDTAYTQSRLDLGYVSKADTLKGQSAPRIVNGAFLVK